MLTNEQLSTFRSQLQKAKKDIEDRFKGNDHFDLNKGHYHESVGELSSYDNHPGDEGSELYEREKDIALNEHVEDELKEINHALKAIEEGTYGKCQVCGKEIPVERLEALPTTTYCIDHTPEQHTSTQRPIEEGVLLPPFGKFEYDDTDAVMYDAEDSWQEVAKWGTSNTPSDFAVAPDDYNETYIESEDRVGYVEDYENFAGNDIEGKNVQVYPSPRHEDYEEDLDEEGTMSVFGDLKPYEIDPYTEEALEEERNDEK
ncbi:yteA family sporulation protein [Salinibacillus xinjiangensis]|uniref:YteA family sporulation protein n=1 Tax=Salinibacillus xinjiangensis TaxID=1229268 RepID=A0A6G1X3V5_9BACI|nr:yteA family sporulation protein [Salinibacillus xinjiangensis]MRG85627.1 yteA family sporulation protein [Salinibacillus xinjiangensis]